MTAPLPNGLIDVFDTTDYRALVERSPDGILLVRDEHIVLANAAAARLCGADAPARMLNSRLSDWLDGDAFARVAEQLNALASEQNTRVDVTTRAGVEMHAELVLQVIQQEGGCAHIVCIRDVTERTRLEDALRRSEERLTLAVAGAQEGVWDWDLESGAVVYSSRWKQMLGYSDEEIEPHVREWERLLHPDDRARADAVHDSVIAGASTYQGEFRLRHKDGHYVHVLSRGFPVRRSPRGSVVRIVGMHLDLTERKRAEAALRESEERLQLAFAGAQEGVWDWNLETGAVVYSSRWKEMLGYNDDEIEPHVSAWERLVHPDDRPRADAAHDSVANGEATYEAEFRLRHKQGHYVHVLSRGFPVRREPAGPVVRIVGTHFDLTERKRAEDLLRRAHEQLEIRVRDRTADLARVNASLREEMHERERAERARMELLGRLVFAQEDERRRIAREMHDQFGEQLTALGVRIRALKQACAASSDLREQVEALETVAQQLDRDVDHLVWELRPTALDDLGLRAALSNYIQDWSARVNIPATLHTTGLLERRLTSELETTLYRIAQEGLTNIAKHSKATRVDVILERRADRVSLIIEDNGVGFDTERASNGFGLLGMQERAALVGATLEIESSAGIGTTILLRMTVPKPEAQEVP